MWRIEDVVDPELSLKNQLCTRDDDGSDEWQLRIWREVVRFGTYSVLKTRLLTQLADGLFWGYKETNVLARYLALASRRMMVLFTQVHCWGCAKSSVHQELSLRYVRCHMGQLTEDSTDIWAGDTVC